MIMISNRIAIFGLDLRLYSITFFLGILATMEFGKRSLIKKYPNINHDNLDNMTIYILFCGLFGARIWYVLSDASHYLSNPIEIIQVWKGGVAVQGAIIGIILGTKYFLKKYSYPINLLKFLDEWFPIALITQAFARWGNFFNQEVYGFAISHSLTKILIYSLITIQAILFIGMVIYDRPGCRFKKDKKITIINVLQLGTVIFYGTLLFRIHFTNYGNEIIQYMFINNQFRLPLFLIEGTLNVFAFIVIYLVAAKKTNFKKLPWYFISYGTIRGSLELLRDPMHIMKIGSIPVSFVLSILFVCFGYILIKHGKKTSK